jgi:hypothetical protein
MNRRADASRGSGQGLTVPDQATSRVSMRGNAPMEGGGPLALERWDIGIRRAAYLTLCARERGKLA